MPRLLRLTQKELVPLLSKIKITSYPEKELLGKEAVVILSDEVCIRVCWGEIDSYKETYFPKNANEGTYLFHNEYERI
jgi:hypothetical protein